MDTEPEAVSALKITDGRSVTFARKSPTLAGAGGRGSNLIQMSMELIWKMKAFGR